MLYIVAHADNMCPPRFVWVEQESLITGGVDVVIGVMIFTAKLWGVRGGLQLLGFL